MRIERAKLLAEEQVANLLVEVQAKEDEIRDLQKKRIEEKEPSIQERLEEKELKIKELADELEQKEGELEDQKESMMAQVNRK